ncbi:hypothetical protein ig2599ANME_2374 [groundwater metagenome]
MKQQDANKLMAFFLAFIMVGSVFFILVFPSDPAQQTEEETQQDFYDPEFWTFNQPFYSISDALNMTPPGAVNADFLDIESMTPQMMEWTKAVRPILAEVDSIYKSDTTKMFYTDLRYGDNKSFLLLSTMDPPKNDFQYIVSPYSYDYHPILIRQEGGLQGFYNVMGNPVMLAPQQTVIDVLEITTSLNETVTSYDTYRGLLSRVPDAPFQTITSNVSFAKQYYMGIRMNNGSYERTTAYLDVNSSTLKNLTRLADNNTQAGFVEFNLTRNGNYTVVRVVSQELLRVLPGNEETS